MDGLVIRKHNCTRIPALIPDYSAIKALPRPLVNQCLTGDCYPLLPKTNISLWESDAQTIRMSLKR
jgi:hypothetical protein